MAKEVKVMFNKERKALESIFHAYVPIVDGIVNEGNEALGMTFESFLSFAKDFDVCPQLMSLNEFKVIWHQTVRGARSAQDLSEAYLSYPQVTIQKHFLEKNYFTVCFVTLIIVSWSVGAYIDKM